MATATVFPDSGLAGGFRAQCNGELSLGRTMGEAIDRLWTGPAAPQKTTLIVVQPFRPDEFFSEAQILRLEELMTAWRKARDEGNTFPEAMQAELQELVNAELQASAARTRSLMAVARQ